MSKSAIVIIFVLTLVWIILVESISIIMIIAGVAISCGCVFFARKFLPLKKIEGVNFNKLIGYPLFLLMQIFYSSIYVSKIIIFGARTDIVEVNTSIKNDSLQVMLADSVTLTPGSLLLELKDGVMTVLWLRPKGSPNVEQIDNVSRQVMGRLEDKLIKAECQSKSESEGTQ